MFDKQFAEESAKKFSEQEVPDFVGTANFARYAVPMEFTAPDGKTVSLSMGEENDEYFCAVTVDGKVKKCFEYLKPQAIAETICEF